MKLTKGWWKARDGSKWHVDWVGASFACGHSENGYVNTWRVNGINTDDLKEFDLIATWTELNLRQWKPEEAPIGAWFRHKRDKEIRYNPNYYGDNGVVFTFKDEGCTTCSTSELKYETLFKFYEHSTDGGKTWKPCGMEVPNE